MNNVFILYICLVSLLSIAYINALHLRSVTEARALNNQLPLTADEIKQLLPGRIKERIGYTPEHITRLVGTTFQFAVSTDVTDETLLALAKIGFLKTRNDALFKALNDNTEARLKEALVEEGFDSNDVDKAVQEILDKSWTEYGAIRAIYEYQRRKAQKDGLIGSTWRVLPAPDDCTQPQGSLDARCAVVPKDDYAEYMAGKEAFVLRVTGQQTLAGLAARLGAIPYSSKLATGDLRLTRDQYGKRVKANFLEAAKKALAELTTPPGLLGPTRITWKLGDDNKEHMAVIDALLEKAWLCTDYASPPSTGAVSKTCTGN